MTWISTCASLLRRVAITAGIIVSNVTLLLASRKCGERPMMFHSQMNECNVIDPQKKQLLTVPHALIFRNTVISSIKAVFVTEQVNVILILCTFLAFLSCRKLPW